MKTILIFIAIVTCAFAQSAPVNASLVIGQSLTMNVAVASGTPPFTYQWQKDGVNIPDAVNNRWYIPAMKATDIGNYTVIVKNPAGQTVSNTAIVSLAVPVVAPAGGTITIILGPKP